MSDKLTQEYIEWEDTEGKQVRRYLTESEVAALRTQWIQALKARSTVEQAQQDALDAARYRDLKAKLEALPRYELHEMWASTTMRPDEYGQWIKREDIAAIFAAEKKEGA